MLTKYDHAALHQQQASKTSFPAVADHPLPQRSIPRHIDKVTFLEPASRLSPNGTPSPRLSLPAGAQRGRANTDGWSDALGAGLQAAIRTGQEILHSSEQALARVTRILGPLPGGFPPGDLSPLSSKWRTRKYMIVPAPPAGSVRSTAGSLHLLQRSAIPENTPDSRWFFGVSCTGPEGDILLDFLQSPLCFLDRLVQRYGGSVGVRLGGEHVVLLTDPKLCREVLIDQADTFRKVIVNTNHSINNVITV